VFAYASYERAAVSLMLINTDDSRSAQVEIEGLGQPWSARARWTTSRRDQLSAQVLLTSYDYSLERPEITEDEVAADQLLRGVHLRPESIKVLTGKVTGAPQNLAVRTVRKT
jgi:hypothetical protein